MQKYRQAVEAKNTQALLKLTDETFRDDGGSSAPEDDLDYKSLPTTVTTRLFVRMRGFVARKAESPISHHARLSASRLGGALLAHR